MPFLSVLCLLQHCTCWYVIAVCHCVSLCLWHCNIFHSVIKTGSFFFQELLSEHWRLSAFSPWLPADILAVLLSHTPLWSHVDMSVSGLGDQVITALSRYTSDFKMGVLEANNAMPGACWFGVSAWMGWLNQCQYTVTEWNGKFYLQPLCRCGSR